MNKMEVYNVVIQTTSREIANEVRDEIRKKTGYKAYIERDFIIES